jgi:hypothetical protein
VRVGNSFYIQTQRNTRNSLAAESTSPYYNKRFQLLLQCLSAHLNGHAQLQQIRIFPERFDRNFGFLFSFCSVCEAYSPGESFVGCCEVCCRLQRRRGCRRRARVRKSICNNPLCFYVFSLSLSSVAQILLPLAHRRRRNHIFGAVESLDFLIANRLLTALLLCV